MTTAETRRWLTLAMPRQCWTAESSPRSSPAARSARSLRVWLGQHFAVRGDSWPWAMFAINVTGSFALGYFATRLQERLPQSTYRRPLLGTGFCGAYTTFSTMQVEILKISTRTATASPPATRSASIAAGYPAIWLATVARAPDAAGRVSAWRLAGVAVVGGVGAIARFLLDALIAAARRARLPARHARDQHHRRARRSAC